MRGIIRKFPFASLLALFGFLVGLLFLSTLDFSLNYTFSEFLKDPVGLFFNYFKESFAVVIKGLLLGIAVGVVLGFAGFIIDLLRRRSDSGISGSVSVNHIR